MSKKFNKLIIWENMNVSHIGLKEFNFKERYCRRELNIKNPLVDKEWSDRQKGYYFKAPLYENLNDKNRKDFFKGLIDEQNKNVEILGLSKNSRVRESYFKPITNCVISLKVVEELDNRIPIKNLNLSQEDKEKYKAQVDKYQDAVSWRDTDIANKLFDKEKNELIGDGLVFWNSTIELLKKQHGDRLVDCALHLDETNIHIHASILNYNYQEKKFDRADYWGGKLTKEIKIVNGKEIKISKREKGELQKFRNQAKEHYANAFKDSNIFDFKKDLKITRKIRKELGIKHLQGATFKGMTMFARKNRLAFRNLQFLDFVDKQKEIDILSREIKTQDDLKDRLKIFNQKSTRAKKIEDWYYERNDLQNQYNFNQKGIYTMKLSDIFKDKEQFKEFYFKCIDNDFSLLKLGEWDKELMPYIKLKKTINGWKDQLNKDLKELEFIENYKIFNDNIKKYEKELDIFSFKINNQTRTYNETKEYLDNEITTSESKIANLENDITNKEKSLNLDKNKIIEELEFSIEHYINGQKDMSFEIIDKKINGFLKTPKQKEVLEKKAIPFKNLIRFLNLLDIKDTNELNLEFDSLDKSVKKSFKTEIGICKNAYVEILENRVLPIRERFLDSSKNNIFDINISSEKELEQEIEQIRDFFEEKEFKFVLEKKHKKLLQKFFQQKLVLHNQKEIELPNLKQELKNKIDFKQQQIQELKIAFKPFKDKAIKLDLKLEELAIKEQNLQIEKDRYQIQEWEKELPTQEKQIELNKQMEQYQELDFKYQDKEIELDGIDLDLTFKQVHKEKEFKTIPELNEKSIIDLAIDNKGLNDDLLKDSKTSLDFLEKHINDLKELKLEERELTREIKTQEREFKEKEFKEKDREIEGPTFKL